MASTTTTTTTRPQRATTPQPTTTTPSTFLHRFNITTTSQSSHLLGFLTLAVSAGILLLLTGITLTAVVLAFIFFTPIIVLSSPFWLPIAIFIFFPIACFLAFCGFGVAALAGFSWLYRYFRGLHPPGSDRFDYARNRIANTAREVKDYAREYGGYLHSKVKDAAPGA